MIYTRLMGGLGNQMFQYAAARRLAIIRKTDVVLDHSHLDNQPEGEVPRFYELDCFKLPAKYYSDKSNAFSFNRIFNKPNKVGLNLVSEKKFSFDPKILKLPDDTELVGYWQSEKYFVDQADLIRRDFEFVKNFSRIKASVAKQISQSEDSIALQIRRGDFASHPVSSKFHGLVPMDYYRAALKRLGKNLKSPIIFVISDDHRWCRDNIKFDFPTIFVKHIPKTGQEDMRLMSLCQHQIIANSTFGWWAAWLNANPKKMIVAPKKWFQDSSIDTSDLIPKAWIRL